MKTRIFLNLFFGILVCQKSFSQSSYAILQDWADYIGYQDTVYKIPSTYDTLGYFIIEN